MSAPDLYPLPPGANLAHYDWVPFRVHKFLGSRFVATVDPAAGFYAVVLWAEAMRQTPAGTLPDDDVELARLAGFGRDVEGWRAVREGALYGWRHCLVAEDGPVRLMHDTVAETAIEQWGRERARAAQSSRDAERARASRLRAVMRKAGLPKRYIDNGARVEAVVEYLRARDQRWSVSNVRAAAEALDIAADSGAVVAMR